MYVKIGKYPQWIGPYQIANLLRKVGVSEDTCHSIGARLAETFVKDICLWVESKRKRTVKIRIDPWDTWSMDRTLADIILPMLKQLKETKHGSPGNLPEFSQTSDSTQLCFDFYRETDNVAWDAGHEHWTRILDEMIWAFEQIQTDFDWKDQYWDDNNGDVMEFAGETIRGGYDMEGLEKHGDRIKNGLELFGKYYQALWD